jgi:hypothetical protein
MYLQKVKSKKVLKTKPIFKKRKIAFASKPTLDAEWNLLVTNRSAVAKKV